MNRERRERRRKSHNNYRRPLPARHFEITEYTHRSAIAISTRPHRRLVVADVLVVVIAEKRLVFFNPPGPVDWTDGKFPNEFIAFHRSRIRVPCTVYGSLLYFILSKNDTSPLLHLTRGRRDPPLCYSSPPHTRFKSRHHGRSCYHTARPKATI